ncbi:hypothetical protein DPM19_08630 [Actinomadura craniellae]|uniref:DUF6286 domain-containing protein n=1 Tax=Actinomadura craniellae TaxID=2231787 RepID=A0A365H9Y2_9ACTN|nr:DUF6286 domain-containing protein [Actinomadura craniellae]RAY15822.1 hypothetical protein DPM19_08630 [Actinomadura craniellae]
MTVRGRTLAVRAARRTFPPARTTPAALAATALTVAGAVVALEVVTALAGRPWYLVRYDRLAAWAAGTRWNDPAVIATTAVVSLLGLGSLLLGVLPGRPRLLPLRADGRDPVFGVTRGGLCRTLAAAAEDVDGVARVRRVRLHGDRVTIDVAGERRVPVGPARAEDDLGRRVEDAVRVRLGELGVRPIEPVIRSRPLDG